MGQSDVSANAVPIRFSSHSLRSTGADVRLEVDGRDIAKYARSVVLRAEVGSITTAEIEILPTAGSEFEMPAAVTVVVIALPGHAVIQEPQEDGTTRWRVERTQE